MTENKQISRKKIRQLTIKSATFDNQLTLVTIVDYCITCDLFAGKVLHTHYSVRTSVCDHTLDNHCEVHNVFSRNYNRREDACRAAYDNHMDNQSVYDTLRL